MNVAIVGWFGTETIGDRAILAGILKIFDKFNIDFDFHLGSIYPFYTERTISEDSQFYNDIFANHNISINIFDSRNRKQLDASIMKCDLLIISGGPLMDIPAMYMLEYSFKLAKKYGKKTAAIGCGLGPLGKKTYQKSALEIIKNSDCTILRDKISYNWYISNSHDTKKNIFHSICPAAFASQYFRKTYLKSEKNSGNHIAFNAREFINESGKQLAVTKKDIDNKIVECLTSIAEINVPIKLVPMHNFIIGCDDRVYLNKLERKMRQIKPSADIEVIDNPLSIAQTMEYFASAKYCVGNRYHSVLMQTILNGNNYIMDYTNPVNGKTIGFIEQINGKEFYKTRYVNLQNKSEYRMELMDNKYEIADDTIEKFENIYIDSLTNLMDINRNG